MKQKIKLELVENNVVSRTEYLYTPETEIEIERVNFGQADVLIKNEGVTNDTLIFRCVNMLIKPNTLSIVEIPVKYKNGIEDAFDELAIDHEELLARVSEIEKTLSVLTENLES